MTEAMRYASGEEPRVGDIVSCKCGHGGCTGSPVVVRGLPSGRNVVTVGYESGPLQSRRMDYDVRHTHLVRREGEPEKTEVTVWFARIEDTGHLQMFETEERARKFCESSCAPAAIYSAVLVSRWHTETVKTTKRVEVKQ